MLRRSWLAVLCVLVLWPVGSASGDLVGQWPFDGNLNDVIGTAHGTFTGGEATYQKGKIRQAVWFDGVNDYVNIPSPTNPAVYTIAAWVKPARTGAAAIITRTDNSGPTASWSHQLRINAAGQFHHYLWVGAERNVAGATVIVPDTWYHVTIVAQNNGPMRLFVNGKEEGTSVDTAGTLWAGGNRIHVGSNSGHAMGWFQGLVDDLQIYNEALPADQIAGIMKSMAGFIAQDPIPEDGATDVARDTILRWTTGEYAATHDVYFGAGFADVNDAGRADARGVLVSRNQTAVEFDPGDLAYGQTYYWRIDEVNAAPDGAIFKGETWSFTAEPYAYPLTGVTATASNAQPNMGAGNVVNASGLDPDGQHSTEATHMWMAGTMPSWIRFEFAQVEKLHEMWVWNSNQALETFLGFGARNVTIEYSVDGETWATLEGVPEFARATAAATYTANTTVSFGGVLAKFVKLTIHSNWGGVVPQTGLSEVRFFYVPVRAFYPQPAVGAVDVRVATDLGWRPGREANSHVVYIGADAEAVATGAASKETLTGHAWTPAGLLLGTEYFWKVDSVGDSDAYAGDVWNFTTERYTVVDDFESYDDDIEAQTTIWHAWIDGLTDGKSGSQVGYDAAPFAEKTVVYGGRQAMPLRYNNTSFAFSEAALTFAPPQDWTAHGVKTLAIHFAGSAGNGGRLYAKVNGTKVVYDGDAGDLARSGWQAWNISLSAVGNVTSVRSLTIGVEGSAAAGTLYLDEIRLYPNAPEYITPTDPGVQDLVASYALDGNLQDSSANKIHGTFTGGTPEWVTGQQGQALQFNGIGGYVDLGANEAMNLTEAMTVACWLKDDGFTRGWQAIFTKGLGWRLQRNGTQANLEWTCPPSPYLFSKSTLDDGEWHHVAGTYDSRRQAIYLDGILDAEQAVSVPIGATTYRVLIGSIDTLTDRVWHGPIDDVRLYKRALKAAEILSLAGQTTPRHKPL